MDKHTLIIRPDFAKKRCVLKFSDGRFVLKGSIVRTRDNIAWTVQTGTAPHKPSSTGRIVVTRYVTHEGERRRIVQEYFPNVVNAEWHRVEDLPPREREQVEQYILDGV